MDRAEDRDRKGVALGLFEPEPRSGRHVERTGLVGIDLDPALGIEPDHVSAEEPEEEFCNGPRVAKQGKPPVDPRRPSLPLARIRVA